MADAPEPYIYADNAATTPLSTRALEAMTPYLSSSFGNPSGIHHVAREAAEALARARGDMARLLGAGDASEVYFTSGGSEADNWVLRGAVRRYRDRYGADAPMRIITSAIEHHAVLHCCEALEREGVQITYLPVDAFGRVDPADLESALTATDAPATALVSIMLANNEVGTIEPIQELAAVAHAHGTPFHTDAVQAVGHIPIDVRELDVDALSLSAHKFHGPKGVGALYLREGFSIPPLIAGGAQERGERAGTENVAGIVGMTAALEEACATLTEDAARVGALRDELAHHVLSAVDGIRLTGAPCTAHIEPAPVPEQDDPTQGPDGSQAPNGGASESSETRTAPSPEAVASIAATVDSKRAEPARLPSIASFTCDGVDGELLIVLLDRAGVAAATGSACSTGSVEPSHVLTAMGVKPARAKGALRLSLATDITHDELDLLKERVPTCIRRARVVSAPLKSNYA